MVLFTKGRPFDLGLDFQEKLGLEEYLYLIEPVKVYFCRIKITQFNSSQM